MMRPDELTIVFDKYPPSAVGKYQLTVGTPYTAVKKDDALGLYSLVDDLVSISTSPPSVRAIRTVATGTLAVKPAAEQTDRGKLMCQYVTGNLKHVFEWEGHERLVRILVDTESWLVVAAQVQRNATVDSFTVASRYEMKDLQTFFEKNAGIFERPVEFGLSACESEQLPGWVTD